MADLETLINQLPNIVYNLKLTIGTSQEIMQQVILINNAQEQLRQIQQAITQNLSLVASKSAVITNRTDKQGVTGVKIPNILAFNSDITGNPSLIAEKFGNPAQEISLINLKSQINSWLEWGDFLQAIAADILGDAHLVHQINLNIQHPHLSSQIQDIVNQINHNSLLKKEQDDLNAELTQVKNRINYIVDTIKNSQNLLTIMLALSSFAGQSGFAIEWLDDAHELIISSDNQFRELTDILNDCEIFQHKINSLSVQLKEHQQAKNQPKKPSSTIINHRTKSIKRNVLSLRIIYKILIMASSLAVLGVGGWIIQHKIPQNQTLSLNLHQEDINVRNFKLALKLGMEAASLAQNPPHPLPVWQKAASKWQQAITLLESIPEGTSVSEQAQERLIRYRLNYLAIKKILSSEKQAVANLKQAEKLVTEANFFMQTSSNSLRAWQQSRDKLQQSINLLETIPKSSAVYKQAQETLPNYRTNYTAINAIMKNRFQSVK